MARCDVTQVKCDRCKKVEVRPLTQDKKVGPDFQMSFVGKDIKFEDLCERCKRALKTAVHIIEEWEHPIKSQKFGPTVATNDAPPLEVAPNFKPASPHLTSLNATTRHKP